jgi:TatD DNase family protein
MIDIHTHLYFPQYDKDRKEVLRRAFDAGIEMMVSVGTEPNDWEKALAMAEEDARISVALGMHPHFFNEQEAGNEERLEWDMGELKRSIEENRERIVAVGECGLDYFSHEEGVSITREQKAWQKRGFVEQIGLARGFGLPVIVHCRPASPTQGGDAYEDLLDILRQKGGDTAFILHCYMGDTEVTKKFLELPTVHFSFTGNITYPVKKAWEGTEKDIRETVKTVPLERMLMETDCPFLAPVPYRGKPNEPSYVAYVAEKIAELKGASVDEVSAAALSNARKIFGLSV